MAFTNGNVAFPATANEDMSSAQYRLVVVTSGQDSTVNVASVAGEPIFGAVQNKPNSGHGAQVDYMGITKVAAGAVVNAGLPIEANATGYGIVSTGSASNRVGYSITGASSGEIFSMMIDRSYT